MMRIGSPRHVPNADHVLPPYCATICQRTSVESRADFQPLRIAPECLGFDEIDPMLQLVRRRLGGIEREEQMV
jgi:hypothetical protein